MRESYRAGGGAPTVASVLCSPLAARPDLRERPRLPILNASAGTTSIVHPADRAAARPSRTRG